MGNELKKLLTVTAGLILVGCTSPIMDEVDGEYNRVASEVDASSGVLKRAGAIAPDAASVRYVNKDWLPVQKVDAAPSPLMEAQMNRQVTINRSFKDIKEFASYLTALTGVPVLVNEGGAAASQGADLQQSAAVSGGSPSAPIPAIMRSASNPFIPTVPESMMDMGQSGGGYSEVQNIVTYNGSMSGLLDLVTAKYNLFWEWDDGSVSLFKTKSKMFRIVALPGSTSLSSSVGNESGGSGSSGSGGSGGGSGGSGGTMSSSSEMSASVNFSEMSVWDGIEKSINAMMSKDGKVAVTPSTGTIIVDDTPPVLRRISQFVDEQNAALSRQVVINVRVLSVTLSDDKNYGINWDAVYESAGDSLSVALSNSFSANENSTNLTFSVLSGSPWDGSKAIINALSKQGKVSQVTSASVVTMNNQLAPFQVGRKNAYLASSSTTVTNDTTTVSLQSGEIVTGFSMNVLPHILDDKKLLLQYSADLSSLLGLNEVVSGTSKIQTPEVDTRNFLQRVMMNSGETLVVTGFEQFGADGETQGIGGARNAMFGGGVNAEQNKTKIVVLIQPVLSGKR